MNMHPLLEKAKAYLDIQLSHVPVGSNAPVETENRFVTISRESGAGGSALAVALADRLNSKDSGQPVEWTVFDRNLVETVLEDSRLSPRLAKFFPEANVGEIRSCIGELLGLHPNVWKLIQQTNELMRRLARSGHVILVGRGGNQATAGIRGGLHVRLVADPVSRAKRTARQLNISHEEARQFNRKVDDGRDGYLRLAFNREVDDAASYDLILNTDRIKIPEAAELLAGMIRKKDDRKEKRSARRMRDEGFRMREAFSVRIL